MIEETVGTLQFIQIHHHLFGCTIYIFAIIGHFVGMCLYNGNHVHIVNPKTCLPWIALLCPFLLTWFGIFGNFPLGIGIRQSQFFVAFILRHPIKLQRQTSEHIQIDMILDGQQLLFGSKQMLKSGLQKLDERFVFGCRRIFKRTVPIEGFGITNPFSGM